MIKKIYINRITVSFLRKIKIKSNIWEIIERNDSLNLRDSKFYSLIFNSCFEKKDRYRRFIILNVII